MCGECRFLVRMERTKTNSKAGEVRDTLGSVESTTARQKGSVDVVMKRGAAAGAAAAAAAAVAAGVSSL